MAEWMGRGRNLLLYAAVLVPVLALWAFIELADQVTEGGLLVVDEGILRAFRNPADLADPRGPLWFEETARDITALGGYPVLILLVLSVSGYLLLRNRYRTLVFLLATTGGGLVVSTALKEFFARPRPDIVPHLTHVSTAGFPSGHAMLSTVVYLTLGMLLACRVSERSLKLYFVAVALLITFLVGISRIYAGVHYPTDVLAGWSAGLAWAVLCGLAARWLPERSNLEPHRNEPDEGPYVDL